VYQYTKKRASGPKCPVTGKKIQGVSGGGSSNLVLFSFWISRVDYAFL
jgi:ribosomal protein L34E